MEAIGLLMNLGDLFLGIVVIALFVEWFYKDVKIRDNYDKQ